MTVSVTITHPTEGQNVKQGALAISGTGPAGETLHLTVKMEGRVLGDWALTVDRNGVWSRTDGPFMPGSYVAAANVTSKPDAGRPAFRQFTVVPWKGAD